MQNSEPPHIQSRPLLKTNVLNPLQILCPEILPSFLSPHDKTDGNLYIIGLRAKMCHCGDHICHTYIHLYIKGDTSSYITKTQDFMHDIKSSVLVM